MVSSIGGINNVQYINALNAFKNNQKLVESVGVQDKFGQSGTQNIDDSILKGVDTKDIKDFAQKTNVELSDDDIKYGCKYGRSVIVDLKT